MPFPAYTQLLASQPPTSAGNYISQTFPPGAQVVIRNMQFVAPTGFLPLEGFRVDRELGGAAVWFMGPGNTIGNSSYLWDGRCALVPDEPFNVSTFEDGWSWSITGFVFSATR